MNPAPEELHNPGSEVIEIIQERQGEGETVIGPEVLERSLLEIIFHMRGFSFQRFYFTRKSVVTYLTFHKSGHDRDQKFSNGIETGKIFFKSNRNRDRNTEKYPGKFTLTSSCDANICRKNFRKKYSARSRSH